MSGMKRLCCAARLLAFLLLLGACGTGALADFRVRSPDAPEAAKA